MEPAFATAFGDVVISKLVMENPRTAESTLKASILTLIVPIVAIGRVPTRLCPELGVGTRGRKMVKT